MLILLYVIFSERPSEDTVTTLFLIDVILVELIGMAIGYYLGAVK